MSKAIVSILILLSLQIIYGFFWYQLGLCQKAKEEKQSIALPLFMGFVSVLAVMEAVNKFALTSGRSLSFLPKAVVAVTGVVLAVDVALFLLLRYKKAFVLPKREVHPTARLVFLLLFGMQCYVYHRYVPEDALLSMKYVHRILHTQLVEEGLMTDLAAVLVQQLGGVVAVVVCFALPVWLLFNFSLLVFALADVLFEETGEQTERIWFVNVVFLLVLLGDYSTRAPSNFLLHGLTTDRGVAYGILLPICFVTGCMLWRRKTVKRALFLWGLAFVLTGCFSKQAAALYGLVGLTFFMLLLGRKVFRRG